MSPFEINVLRFIFTLDNILVSLTPWLKAMSAVMLVAGIAMLARTVIRRRTGLAKR